MIVKKSVLSGGLGTLFLALIYIAILTIAESLQHAVTQFISMWPWITLLLIGFGIQLGLYSFMRLSIKNRNKRATAEVATTGGVSAAAMIACCAHHLVDVLPILGFSAAAVFFAEFQVPFIVLGIVSNIIGIFMMLYLMQKHGLTVGSRFLRRLTTANLKRATATVGVASALVVGSTFLFVGVQANAESTSSQSFELSSVSNDENYVTFEVTPIDFNVGQPLSFEISMNTHQVDLNFNLMEIASLSVNDNTMLKPIAWEGAAPGGHHRSGLLKFGEIQSMTDKIVLVIKNVAEVPERIFEWQLN